MRVSALSRRIRGQRHRRGSRPRLLCARNMNRYRILSYIAKPEKGLGRSGNRRRSAWFQFEDASSATNLCGPQGNTEMRNVDRIHELLNRNLQEVFGEEDAARRRAAIEELYTDDCVRR